jgi:hypothetical protein
MVEEVVIIVIIKQIIILVVIILVKLEHSCRHRFGGQVQQTSCERHLQQTTDSCDSQPCSPRAGCHLHKVTIAIKLDCVTAGGQPWFVVIVQDYLMQLPTCSFLTPQH